MHMSEKVQTISLHSPLVSSGMSYQKLFIQVVDFRTRYVVVMCTTVCHLHTAGYSKYISLTAALNHNHTQYGINQASSDLIQATECHKCNRV